MPFLTQLYNTINFASERIALREGDEACTYASLKEEMERRARAFLRMGLKPGDRVVILLPNSKEFIFCFLGLLRIKIIAIPLKHDLTHFELEPILANCNPAAIIATLSFINKIAGSNLDILQDKILILAGGQNKARAYCNTPLQNTLTLDDFCQIGEQGFLPEIPVGDTSAPATINYTYRGYGYPLGACLSQENYFHGIQTFIKIFAPQGIKKTILVLPGYHIFPLLGSILFPLFTGAEVIILKNYLPREIFKALDFYQIDYMIGVPTLYKMLVKNFPGGDYNLPSFQYSISGGSLLSNELYAEIKEILKLDVLQGYGMTEAVPIMCNPLSANKPESVGISWNKEAAVKIVDDQNNELNAGQTGEIIMKGPHVTSGYYARPHETNEIIKQGWFYTGDYGLIDKDGYLYFKGLKKEICKVGGHTVDLKEVEDVFLKYPGVSKVKINLAADSLWGTNITAEVYGDNGKNGLTEKKIRAFCQERLSTYKIPRRIIINERNTN